MRRINNYFTFACMNRNNILFPALLVILWLVMVFIVNPIGNFPLNDDWQYSRPVWFLVNKGFYLSTDQYSPIIAAQVLWGSLFCLPGGFSFTALRISTLALSLAGVLIFYFLLVRLSKNEKLSFLGALLLAVNPLYIAMSHSFMTDVPFLTFSLFSVYFFFLSMDSGKRKHILIATLFSILATLIRQYGVAIPVAYTIACIIRNRPKIIQSLTYFFPTIITLVALKLTLLWLKHIGSELRPYEGAHAIDFLKKPADISAHLLERGSFILAYTGFFLLPLLAYTTFRALSQMTKRQRIAIFSVILLFVPILIIWSHSLPYGNILNPYGIGAGTLKNFNLPVNQDNQPLYLKLLKGMAFIGAIMLLINLGKMIMDIILGYIEKNITTVLFKRLFILFFFAGYAVLIFIPNFFFDRYLLPFFPLATILILAEGGGNIRIRIPMYVTYCFITIAIGLISSAMTHDYLRWNEASWQATNYLTKDMKIPPHKIDGGYEFNGWTLGTYFPDNPQNPNRSKWFVDDDEYVVSQTGLDGYTIIKQFPYQNYFPCEIKNICVLHRK
jgi:4-amino-4-deoxy-L-arabinose transferase-like glycosyltransferase